MTLQRALASIRRLGHPAFNQATQELSRYAIDRAIHAGLFEADVQQLRDAAVEGRRRTSHRHGPDQSGIS